MAPTVTAEKVNTYLKILGMAIGAIMFVGAAWYNNRTSLNDARADLLKHQELTEQKDIAAELRHTQMETSIAKVEKVCMDEIRRVDEHGCKPVNDLQIQVKGLVVQGENRDTVLTKMDAKLTRIEEYLMNPPGQ